MLWEAGKSETHIQHRRRTMSDSNVVRVETLKELTIMVAAPGATKENTIIHTDVGPKTGDVGGGTIHLEVGKPDISDELQEKVDLSFEEKIPVSSQFDLRTIKAGVRDGLIFIKIKASKDRITEVQIDKE